MKRGDQVAGSEQRLVKFRLVTAGSTLGRYELAEELGSGGMATVYRGRDTELRRDVALKVLFPHLCKRRDIVARFQREARAAAGLDHPHIVRVYDVGGGPKEGTTTVSGTGTEVDDEEACDPPYIVMELVRGSSLEDFWRDQGWQRGAEVGEVVACIGVVIAAALAEAHRAGIIHRDVKPSNIMVAEGGRLALADFGVARIEEDDGSVVTRSGALIGTPGFMSPEQAFGDELDARSDIYSLGATLYRLATGTAPYHGPMARVVAAIARGDSYLPPLMRNPAMGTELAHIIERMMAKDPAQRYSTCDDAARALCDCARASGFDEPDNELTAFFADPEAYAAERIPQLSRATLDRAEQAARAGKAARAIALADRILALEPEGPRAKQAMELVEGLGTGRQIGKWLVVAALVALCVGLVVATQWPGDHQTPWPDAAIAMVESHSASDAGLARHVSDAATEATEAPQVLEAPVVHAAVTRADAAPQQERPSLRSRRARRRPPKSPKPPQLADAGSPAPVAARSVDAAPARVAPEIPAKATITLDIRPWCDVSINGQKIGRVQRGRVLSLAPGKHEIVCSQGQNRPEWRKTIDLEPGQHLPLRGTVLRPVRIRVVLGKGDRLVIDQRSFGDGTSLQLLPGRYRADVFRGPRKVTTAWVSVPAIGSCTIRDQPSLGCYP